MAEERVQRRLAAILAADVVGYSRLMGEDEAGITAHLQRNFGHPFRFNFIYVEEIPREPGGKFQIFKSELM